VGADEFNSSLSTTGIAGPGAALGPAPTLAQYLASRDGVVLTGHSQGGAQAQLAAIEAGNSGTDIGRVVTFNAGGISAPDASDVLPSASRVIHFVNASDIVSVVGETFLESDYIRYYDHTDASGIDAFSIYTAHSAQWMQSELRAYFPTETFPNSVLIDTGPDWSAFTNSDYSPISFIYGQDREYLEMMIDFISIGYVIDDLEDFKPLITGGLGGAPQAVLNLIRDEANIRSFIDDTFIPALSTRGGLENVRGGEIGALFGKTLNAIGEVAQLIEAGATLVVDGVFNVFERIETLRNNIEEAFRDAVFTTVDQTIDGLKLIAGTLHGIGDAIKDGIAAGSEAVMDWVVDRLSGSSPVVVQDGVHAGSSPAVVINTIDGAGGSLSSAAPNSLFLLSDLGTQVVQTGGGNVVWGVAADLDGTNVIGGVTTTDAMFIQNEFFNTEDMERDSGSAIISVDLDQDGETDITITWEGNYRLESIVAEQGTDGTYIRYLGNGLPEATNDAFDTSESSSFTTGNVLENDTDEDGDELSITGLDSTGTLGVVTDNGDGTFGYDPNGAFEALAEGETATDTFAYFATDGVETVRGEVIITIKGLNDLPSAVDDVASVSENGSVVVDPLENDSDPDINDVLTLVSATSVSGATVQIENNQFVYFADADVFDLLDDGEATIDTVTYTIRDKSGAEATAIVTVDVIGQPDGMTIHGTRKPDMLVGTDGEDKIYAGRGDDIVNAGGGADVVHGGRGADRLFGEESIDTLYGQHGDDFLDGGAGNDILFGGQGSDTLVGGLGDDIMSSGKGPDTFEFAVGDGTDRIVDFDARTDMLRLTGGLNFDDITFSSEFDGVRVSYSPSDSLHLVGVDMLDLEIDCFEFV